MRRRLAPSCGDTGALVRYVAKKNVAARTLPISFDVNGSSSIQLTEIRISSVLNCISATEKCRQLHWLSGALKDGDYSIWRRHSSPTTRSSLNETQMHLVLLDWCSSSQNCVGVLLRYSSSDVIRFEMIRPTSSEVAECKSVNRPKRGDEITVGFNIRSVLAVCQVWPDVCNVRISNVLYSRNYSQTIGVGGRNIIWLVATHTTHTSTERRAFVPRIFFRFDGTYIDGICSA